MESGKEKEGEPGMTRRLWIGIALAAILLLAGSASAYPRAVLFTFDDARGTVYTTGYPIFANHGYNATFYIVTSEINTEYYPGKSSINLSQLRTLYNAGWDIGDHTRHHTYVITDTLNLSEQITEIQGGRADLDAWGLTRASRHLAFPGGQYDANTTTAMNSAGMLTGRTVQSAPPLTVPPVNNDVFHLTGVRGLNNQSDEDEEYTYLASLSSDTVVIYLTHGVDDPTYGASTTTSAMLDHLMDYTDLHHIPVWTITQLYANISAPVANFTATPRGGTGPLSVSFTDTSTKSPTSWKWAYKNATVGWTQFATTRNPVFMFPAGTYDINLTATNGNGSDAEVKTGYISVTGTPVHAPVASFVGTPVSGTAPLTVAFTDSSTGSSITNRRWDFGDGNISNYVAATNPSHRYASAGTYSVNLTVTNAGGSSSLPRAGYITVSALTVAPVANFAATPLTGTGPLSVGFTDTSANSPTSWRWAYKNATVGWTQFATIPNPSIILAAGMYDINLTVTNAAGSGTITRPSYIRVSGASPPYSVGVYRPSAHTFYLNNGTTTAINWGAGTDLPVTGDWNGDGKTDVGVYRPSAHTFYLKNGTALSWITTVINWGASADLPVTGDWNGDGITDVGVFRPSTHTFYLKNGTALSWTTTVINWGAGADRPVTGIW